MVTQQLLVQKAATFSPSGRHRYTLERIWNPDNGLCLFIMLNPSTADAIKDDRTIRRCIHFSVQWGYGGLLVGNIFALRSTDPKKLYTDFDPVGSRNDENLLELADRSSKIIVAWGTHGKFMDRGNAVRQLLSRELYCLRKTAAGHPNHPLYLPHNLEPILW